MHGGGGDSDICSLILTSRTVPSDEDVIEYHFRSAARCVQVEPGAGHTGAFGFAFLEALMSTWCGDKRKTLAAEHKDTEEVQVPPTLPAPHPFLFFKSHLQHYKCEPLGRSCWSSR